ncbi:TrmH family RNA methyltransferase [Pseudoxanthomonas indica]|uniref:RNA methyltransferase, TrmH family n=1 Tax=Pseudoxanthomonas indica TaxID=428993 RepID=A0A1T5JRY1_9GAMM|nr:RNA methyltransferase [Pseudoxanthomonas indica]GGD43971.1 tRNA/rRNA methyltransferase [Pseudoxanthomonas indica]SKC54124.1 RNA methyltransferase, TrmH family [Pseudoxanthomonas indica]
MSNPWDNTRPPSRGPGGPKGPRDPRDPREHREPRAPAAARGGQRAAPPRAARAPSREWAGDEFREAASEPAAPHAGANRSEVRLYGINAVQAVFEQRPEAIRKVYLDETRIPRFKALLAWCVKQRVGYRVVAEQDLDKLAGSQHHEGIVAEVLKSEPAALRDWLRELPPGPALALWLDGVGNPHNFGAILRSAAHFGVSAILLPNNSHLAVSGAAARVAEGGAERVPLVRMGAPAEAIDDLHEAGFALAATMVRDGMDLFDTGLPERLVYVMGAEGEGMDLKLAAACDARVSIPGTGAVESLNVAAATAVMLALWRQQRD